MAPTDVWISINGHEENEKAAWERMRMNCFFVHIHAVGKKAAKSPSDMMPLPWDKNPKARRVNNPREVFEDYLKRKAEAQKKKDGRSTEDKNNR